MYYDKFPSNVNLTEDAKDYSVIQSWLLEELSTKEDQDKVMGKDIEYLSDKVDLVASLKEMGRAYGLAQFNLEAKIWLAKVGSNGAFLPRTVYYPKRCRLLRLVTSNYQRVREKR